MWWGCLSDEFGIPADPQDGPVIIHASCVACQGRAALILGPSGAGKSALALQMIAAGADLVADDRVILTAAAKGVTAAAPKTIAGLIEARGIGLLRAAQAEGPVEVRLAVDLAHDESERLPPERTITVMGQRVPLLRRVAAPHFAAALILFLKSGRLPQQ